MKKAKITALVPMRHNSERVPGKNYRQFGGVPLFCHVVRTLLQVDLIDNVVVDTDSHIIIDILETDFPSVSVLLRPQHLRDGSIAMNDVILNAIEQFPSDFYLLTHSTNPLLKTDSIKNAIEIFLANYPMYDSLFSVTRKNVRYWDVLCRPINHNENILLRTQDLPPIYEENSCMYIFNRDTILQKHNRIGNRPYLFEIDALEAQDIDEELDFKVAEFLFNEINKSKEI